MMGWVIEHRERWQTGLSKEEWSKQLAQYVEPIEQFRLISRLSGAGIVVRTLEQPETERVYMGISDNGGWRIAQILEAVNISPYQPIVQLTPAVQSGVLNVEVVYSPHQDVYLLSPLEWIGGVLCVFAGIVGLAKSPLALGAILLGVGIVLLPRVRARWSFEKEVIRARESLKELPIDWGLIQSE